MKWRYGIVLGVVLAGTIFAIAVHLFGLPKDDPYGDFPASFPNQLNTCPSNEMLIISAYNGYFTTYSVNFDRKIFTQSCLRYGVDGWGGRAPAGEMPVVKRWALTNDQLSHIKECLARLTPGESGYYNFNEDRHVAFWENGTRRVYHYRPNAEPELVGDFLQNFEFINTKPQLP